MGKTKNAEALRTLLTVFKVLKKYNLACGPISTYKGVIPEENVEAIVKAGKELHKIKNINNMQWIPRIDINSDMPKSMVNEIVEYFSRFPFVVDGNICVL